MEFKDVINNRYSTRRFSQRPVEPEKLDAILEAGRIAPTAGNRQPQRILVVRSEASLEKMHECTPCHFEAPIVLVVCYEKLQKPAKGEWFNGDFGQVDACIVLTHMMLAATDLGLGSCWVGMYKKDKLRAHFNIPDAYEIVSIMPIGYPAEDDAPWQLHSERNPMADSVWFDAFG